MSRSGPRLRIPWWGRLEARVIGALVLLGVFCVGASAYLVQSTVSFFDARLGDTLERSDAIADAVKPFYTDLVEARVEGYRARARAFAMELELGRRDRAEVPERARLLDLRDREPDVVRLRLIRGGSPPEVVEVNRTAVHSDEDLWFAAKASVAAGAPGVSPDELEVVFRRDPEIDARYQALGQQKREIGFAQAQQPVLERTVFKVVGLVSALVLGTSVLVGFWLARATTRKAKKLSDVMVRVGHGDLAVRARHVGPDELGQLAAAFNEMLDELAAAQRKVAYLQRIGAWQEMARRLAHEIKNPLTPIQLAVQQLRDKDPGLSEEFTRLVRTSAEIVEDEIDGLRRMVSSFSRFSKLPEVQLERLAVSDMLTEFERAYGHLTEGEGDVLEVRGPDEPVEIAGDQQLIKQSLVNLVDNAMRAGREAGHEKVRVVVRVAGVAGRPGQVELRVEDDGPGVADDRRERIFEPYETSREDGTGLGLAIVKKVVLDHGGEIRVEASELGGAAFVIRLPRVGLGDTLG